MGPSAPEWEVVSLITLNHRWQGYMVGPVGDAAAA